MNKREIGGAAPEGGRCERVRELKRGGASIGRVGGKKNDCFTPAPTYVIIGCFIVSLFLLK